MSAAEYLDRVEAAAESGPDLWDIERSLVHLSVDEYQRRMTMLIKTAAALRAVLAVDRRDLDESPDYEERLWDQGFNEALSDVVTAITAALDGAP